MTLLLILTIKLNKMEVVRQITTEQLETITNQQKDLNALLVNIGVVESQKHMLLHQMADLNNLIEETKNKLQEEYGAININLTDGSYTEIEPEAVVEA
jgi:predicted  nucleic acid-binding Zn-ribbon protein